MTRAISTVLLLLTSGSAAWAQSIAITNAAGAPAWRAAHGEKVVIAAKDLACDPKRKEPVLTFGAHPVDAIQDAQGKWAVTVPEAVAPAAQQVEMACGGANASAWLTVTPSKPMVVCARNRSPKPTAKRPPEDKCGVGLEWEFREHDQIELEVYRYDELLKQPEVGNKPRRLFLAGVELKNVDLRVSKRNPDTERWTLWTQLDFDNTDDANRKAWVQLLQRARNSERLEVSVGPEGGPQWASSATLEFNVYPTGWARFTIIVIAALLIGTIALGAKTNLLRGPACAGGPPPYSLARHQMAVWFVVVLSAYLFLILITGRAATSPTALILIGISGATGLAAVVIDAQQNQQASSNRVALAAEETALKDALDNPQSGLRAQAAQTAPGSTEAAQLAATIQAKTQRLAEVTALLQQSAGQQSPSRGWFRDLLSDANGVSFHRLQIVGWTIVLVGVFVRVVWRDFAMPDFDATTLTLMGVSSGTYLGFKLPG